MRGHTAGKFVDLPESLGLGCQKVVGDYPDFARCQERALVSYKGKNLCPSHANAYRLTEAAPELWEACKALIDAVGYTTIAHSDEKNGILAKLPAARAALAKAEGR
jgi:hypothetical protein